MMKHSLRLIHRARQKSPSPALAAVAILAAAGLVLVAAACGGKSSSAGSGGSANAAGRANAQVLAYSSCVRSHGVPSFPDPDSSGTIPKMTPEQLGVSTSQLQAAESACAHLLEPTQDQEQQVMSGMLALGRCMRSHGVPNWPDPTTDSNGLPVFNIPGIDPLSPQVSDAFDACSHLLQPSTNGHPTTIELCGGVGEDGRCHGYGNPNS